MKKALERIAFMNDTFELENNRKLTDLGYKRLEKFVQVMDEELEEFTDVYPKSFDKLDGVALADWLGDLLVYVLSEAVRWGVPIEEVFHAILDSQESKLVDGKPLKAPDNSKFIKGPDYVPPEPVIRGILERQAED
jgi:predicted HAD superfamily Cof-like phosphohydrolase